MLEARSMHRFPRLAAVVVVGAVLAACSSNSGDEQTGSSNSASSVAHALESPTPCPAGDSCIVSSVNLQPPFSGCATPSWLTQTGTTPASYAVTTCPTGTELTTWISGQSVNVATPSSVPEFYPASA